MEYASKKDIENIIKLTDKQEYKNIIVCSKGDKYYIKYRKRADKEISNIISNIEIQGLNIEDIYDLKEPIDIKDDVNKGQSDIAKYALEFATLKHKGQFRKGKNPKEYITHPINVATIVLRHKKNAHNIDNLVAAAYLHDTLEDTDTTYHDLVEYFGTEVASLVFELTTDKDLKNAIGKAKYLSIKMKNMTDDALIIKLCDRLDNISDINKTDDKFKNKYINETLYIIEYLIKNRKLSNTQLNIVKTILVVLETTIVYTYDDNSKETHNIMKLINVIE